MNAARRVEEDAGIKKAIDVLEDQVGELFERVHEIEMNGSPTTRHLASSLDDLKGEFKDVKKEIRDLRSVIYRASAYAGGGVAILGMVAGWMFKHFMG